MKVDGLDNLKTSIHVVNPGEIYGKCIDSKNVNILNWPLACAIIRFDKWTCDVYIAENSASDTVEHELLHCQGYDHNGDIQKAFDEWQNS